jgi:hypothetical protein
MAAKPELRFASATEMRLALQAATGGAKRAHGAGAGMPGPQRTAAGATVELSGQVGSSPGSPAVPPRRTPEPEPPHVDTIRAPPIATALTPSPYVAPPIGGGRAPVSHPRRSRGPMIALIALPLLLGVGVVAVVAATGTCASSGPAASPTAAAESPRPADSGHPAPADSVAPGAGTSAAVPTLAPAKAMVAPPAHLAAPTGRPGPVTPAAGDGGSPPPMFPPGLPGALPPFPTALPSGLGLPSGFPTTFPSGFPSVLPAWPPPMPASSAAGRPAASADPAY